jgi:hypothetical protein
MCCNILFRSVPLKICAAPVGVKWEPSTASAVAQSRRETYSVHETAPPLRPAYGALKAWSSFSARRWNGRLVFGPHHGPMTTMVIFVWLEWLHAHNQMYNHTTNQPHLRSSLQTSCMHCTYWHGIQSALAEIRFCRNQMKTVTSCPAAVVAYIFSDSGFVRLRRRSLNSSNDSPGDPTTCAHGSQCCRQARAYQVVWDAVEKFGARVTTNEVPQIRVAPKEHPLRRDLGGGS